MLKVLLIGGREVGELYALLSPMSLTDELACRHKSPEQASYCGGGSGDRLPLGLNAKMSPSEAFTGRG